MLVSTDAPADCVMCVTYRDPTCDRHPVKVALLGMAVPVVMRVIVCLVVVRHENGRVQRGLAEAWRTSDLEQLELVGGGPTPHTHTVVFLGN